MQNPNGITDTVSVPLTPSFYLDSENTGFWGEYHPPFHINLGVLQGFPSLTISRNSGTYLLTKLILKYKIERLRIMLDGLELVTEVFMLSGGHCDAKFAA